MRTDFSMTPYEWKKAKQERREKKKYEENQETLDRLAVGLLPAQTDEQAAVSRAYLAKEFELDVEEFKSVDHALKLFKAVSGKLDMRKADNRHVRVIAFVLSFYEHIASSSLKSIYISVLCEKSNVRITRRTDILALIMRYVANFGDNDKCVVSRNVQAMKYLSLLFKPSVLLAVQ